MVIMVRRKYKIRLTVLAILLVLSLTVEFDYQLWKIDNRQTDLAITESGCVEIIYSDDKSFNLVNPEATKDSDGPRTIPKTISISNNCSDIKTINVTMDVLNTSSIESNKVKVYINGDENQEPTLLSELKELKNSDEEIKEKSEKVAAHKPQTQFGKNRGDMFLHSLDTDVELIGDLAVFQARLAAKQKDTLT